MLSDVRDVLGWLDYQRIVWYAAGCQLSVINVTRDVTDSASESDRIRHFSEIQNPMDTWNPITSDSKLLTSD